MTDKKPCKRPGKGVTKEMLRDAHKVKMEAKKILNAHNRDLYRTNEYIMANLSVNHPNFGDTPQEDEKRKRSEKSS